MVLKRFSISLSADIYRIWFDFFQNDPQVTYSRRLRSIEGWHSKLYIHLKRTIKYRFNYEQRYNKQENYSLVHDIAFKEANRIKACKWTKNESKDVPASVLKSSENEYGWQQSHMQIGIIDSFKQSLLELEELHATMSYSILQLLFL